MSSRAAQTARDLTIGMKTFYVYMMTNRSRVVLYIGITNSLERRTWYHRSGNGKSFTQTYNGRSSGLLRAIQRRAMCHNARKGNQGMAKGEEE